MTDTNRDSQDALGSEPAAETLLRLLCESGTPKIICSACLLISHVTWNHQANQRRYGTETAIRTLLSLLSPAGRLVAIGSSFASTASTAGGATPTVAPTPNEPLMTSHASSELVLYSMMALVNLSYCNERVQQLVKSCGGIPLIQAQLQALDKGVLGRAREETLKAADGREVERDPMEA